MNKNYDYDAIMKLTGEGGTLDNALTTLQTNLKNFRAKIEECEESFHGKQSGSSIYKAYDKLLNGNLGKTTSVGSYWWTTNEISLLANSIYSNAENDKMSDTGA